MARWRHSITLKLDTDDYDTLNPQQTPLTLQEPKTRYPPHQQRLDCHNNDPIFIRNGDDAPPLYVTDITSIVQQKAKWMKYVCL